MLFRFFLRRHLVAVIFVLLVAARWFLVRKTGFLHHLSD